MLWRRLFPLGGLGKHLTSSSGVKNAAPTGQGTQSCRCACNHPARQRPKENVLSVHPACRGYSQVQGLGSLRSPGEIRNSASAFGRCFLSPFHFNPSLSDFNHHAPEKNLWTRFLVQSSFSVCPSDLQRHTARRDMRLPWEHASHCRSSDPL